MANKKLDLKQISQTIVRDAKQNMSDMFDKDKQPNLYWNLEKAMYDALLYVKKATELNALENMKDLIKEFDNDDGHSNQ